MKTRIIGDIHGKFYDYQLLTEAQEHSIQVGDFGFGFNDYWDDRAVDWHGANPGHRFIRGNHDNPAQCKKSSGFIQDGFVENDVMFIGGAWSIDWGYRTEGVDWWRDEECTMEQFYHIISVYEQVKPRIMITHDAPLSVTEQMFIKTGRAMGGSNARSIKTLTGSALQMMFEIHQPDEWYFGHWHHTVKETIEGTQFQCIGECDFVDVEL